jgi:transcriptional regulator with XRE-family HTH domain
MARLGRVLYAAARGVERPEITMTTLAAEIGRALRRARSARGMTLQELAALSAGRFKPTSVAGYERGERRISLESFVDLCRLLDAAPEEVLAEILRAIERGPQPDVDLAKLETLVGRDEARIISGFLRRVRDRRLEPAETVGVRAGDVEVLASASGRSSEQLVEALRVARRAPTDDPEGAQPDAG